MIAVHVQNAAGYDGLPGLEDFQHWVELALQGYPRKAEICIRIVDPAESAQLNRQYRHKGSPTNVLSFPADLPDFVQDPSLGDLVLCAEVVAREAGGQDKPIREHWAHLVIHGCLHLLGFDHEHDREARIMEKQETLLLARCGIGDPYHVDGGTNEFISNKTGDL